MRIFQKIVRERPAGVRGATFCSSRSRMSRPSVSVVPPAVRLYDACWIAKTAGGDGGAFGRPATRVYAGAVKAMSLHLVSRVLAFYPAQT